MAVHHLATREPDIDLDRARALLDRLDPPGGARIPGEVVVRAGRRPLDDPRTGPSRPALAA